MKNLKVNCRNCVFKFTIPGEHSNLFKIGYVNNQGEIDHSVIITKVSNEHAYCPACGALLQATTLQKAINSNY